MRLHRPLRPLSLLLMTLTMSAWTGCVADRAYYTPREQNLTEAPDGYTAAEYALGEENETLGEVRVWSRGAWVDKDQGNAWLHLGLEVENRSGGPLTVDLQGTRILFTDQTGGSEIQAAGNTSQNARELKGRTQVDDNGVQVFYLQFSLQDRSPSKLGPFTADWALKAEDGTEYRWFTAFKRSSNPNRSNVYFVPATTFYYGAGYYGTSAAYDPWCWY